MTKPDVAGTTAAGSPGMSHRQVLTALSGLLLGMFVSMLGNTVVSTSLPVIIHDLDGGQAAFTWVVTAMLLTMAISTPIWGKLADLFNRKLLIQLAIVIFVVATAAAGFALDTGTLIAFRALQGVGAGGLAALSQVIMADIISPRERGRYMGLFGAVMALATIGGPLVGGVITDTLSWRWNFYIALPFALGAMILLQRTLRPTRPSTTARIDYLGIVLMAVSVCLLLIWVTLAGRSFDWWSVPTVVMVGGGVLSAGLFVLVEVRAREPLLPLSLFRNRTFALAVIASIATGIALFGASVFLSQYMQLARGATPTQAGLMTIPMIGGLLVAAIGVGQLVSRFGYWKPYLIVGALSLIAGSSLLSTIHSDTDFILVSVYMFLLGAGVGATIQNLVLIVQNTTKPTEVGAASAGVTFFRNLGGTIGVSVMGAVVASSVTGLMATLRGELSDAILGLGPRGAEIAVQLQSGTLPQVSELPAAVRVIVEEVYAEGISQAFLITVPFAVLSLIAIALLPNVALGRMTTLERIAAEEADVSTSVSQGMDAAPGATVPPTPDEAGAVRLPDAGHPGSREKDLQ